MDQTFPNIGITYDPSHYVMQGISLLETKEIVPYSHHVHIRNARQGAMQAGMDDGEISLEEFVGMLGDSNYNGYVSIEYFNGFDGGCANTEKYGRNLFLWALHHDIYHRRCRIEYQQLSDGVRCFYLRLYQATNVDFRQEKKGR